jgi:MerR family transcriptional regulator, copper efflux regulator
MQGLSVGAAAERTGWTPRMLRYLERARLVVPRRTESGYRAYGLRELTQLRSLRELRERFDVGIAEVAFAARLEREPALRAAVARWLAGSRATDWVDWEQRKQERLLAA